MTRPPPLPAPADPALARVGNVAASVVPAGGSHMSLRPSWESCSQRSSAIISRKRKCLSGCATIVRFGPDFASQYGSVPNKVARKAAFVVDSHGQASDDPSGCRAKPRHGPIEVVGRPLEHVSPRNPHASVVATSSQAWPSRWCLVDGRLARPFRLGASSWCRADGSVCGARSCHPVASSAR